MHVGSIGPIADPLAPDVDVIGISGEVCTPFVGLSAVFAVVWFGAARSYGCCRGGYSFVDAS